MLEAALRAKLAATTAVAALVGTGTATRIYPVALPQKPTLPAITYQRVSGTRDLSAEGVSGLAFARVQIDCWASESYAQVKELVDEVRKALSGWCGGAGGVTVQLVEVDADRDDFASEVNVWRSSIDLGIWFEEETA